MTERRRLFCRRHSKGSHAMSGNGRLRSLLRTAAAAFICLILFVTFALALTGHERTHRLSDVLSVSSNAQQLLKFSLDDSPLMAAAVVVTAVPVGPHTAFSTPRHPPKNAA